MADEGAESTSGQQHDRDRDAAAGCAVSGSPAAPAATLTAPPSLLSRQAWTSIAAFGATVIERFNTGIFTVDSNGIIRGPTIDFPE